MSIDITKLAQLGTVSHQAMDSVLNTVTRSAIEQGEHLRRLTNLMPKMPSAIERFLEEERRRKERYQDLFSASTWSTMDSVARHSQELERIAEMLGPSRETMDAIATGTLASTQMAADMARLVDPLRSVLDKIKAEQVLATPWFAQMESAAQLAQRFLESWPEDEESDEDVDWEALDQHLDGVQVAIQQLPLRNATDQQLQATGMTRFEWITLAVALLTLLLQFLDYMESLEQRRFASQQAEAPVSADRAQAEERMFRERLIATIEALAEHTPAQDTLYVVGTRPVPVKSAIVRGVYLGTAHPNQVVVVTGRNGRWIKIRFRDNLEEREIEGWILKHYLVRRPAG